jgi:hypothetical protein
MSIVVVAAGACQVQRPINFLAQADCAAPAKETVKKPNENAIAATILFAINSPSRPSETIVRDTLILLGENPDRNGH